MKSIRQNDHISVRLFVLIFLILVFGYTKSFSQTKDRTIVEESTFKITNENHGIEYKSVENTYKVFYKPELGKSDYYLARYKTTTFKNLSEEGQERTIEVIVSPMNQLSLMKYKIKQNCDQLDLLDDFYKTTKYGCCLRLSEVRLYDYSNNLIIAGTEKIFHGEIPNNYKHDFYFSYTAPTDTLTLGKVNFWFNMNEKYQIELKSKRSTEHDSIEVCPVLYPKIAMNLTDKDRFDNEETYTFHSLQKIKSTSEINFSLTLTFDCDSTILPIRIPIINGKPFENKTEKQIYNVEYK
jgi:hypothetical protein